jgi:hypothetical protein
LTPFSGIETEDIVPLSALQSIEMKVQAETRTAARNEFCADLNGGPFGSFRAVLESDRAL